MSADYSQSAVHPLGLNALAGVSAWAGVNALANLHAPRLLDLNALAGLNMPRLLDPNVLADLNTPPPAGVNAWSVWGVNAWGVNTWAGDTPLPLASVNTPRPAGVNALANLLRDLDAVAKRAGNQQLRQVDAPCPAMQGAAGPPNRACFLLDLFLGKADRDIMRGDLEEEFATSILPRYGERRALFWFWWQTVRTIATRNAVCRWGLVTGLARLGEWISRGING